MWLLCLYFIFFYINVSKALNKRDNVISTLNKLNDYKVDEPVWNYFGRRFDDSFDDDELIQNTRRDQTNDESGSFSQHVWLSLLRKNHDKEDQTHEFGQRAFRNRRRYTDESGRESSTSMEMQSWKQQFDEDWNREKEKALQQKRKVPTNAVLNMVAARPWSLPCGDPMQHDQPWGTCTLSFQCMPSLRIYRGDFQCGHTNFICCSALATHHDMYQGFDMSFIDTGSSSTGERAKYGVKSSRIRFNKRRREKIRRWKNRVRSKKRLKRMIKRLSHEIKKNLHRAFRNTSMDRKNKVKNMKKTIKLLKNKFRDERLKLKQRIHADIEKADDDLKTRLINVNTLNSQYLTNETFRALLNKFNLTLNDIRALRSIPPELKPYLVSAMNDSNDVAVDRAGARKFEEKVTETGDYVMEETKTAENLPRVANDSSVESDAYSGLDGKLSDGEQGELDEITSVPHDYNMVKETVASPVETRRFVGGIVGAQSKHGKKLKSEDYISYDIEYGELHY